MEAFGDDRTLIEFVYREARLIDEKCFDDWYDLFAEDGRYWMPLMRGQAPGAAHTSLFDEDKLLLKLRIDRLRNPQSYSQAYPSWCQHILQTPSIESRDLQSKLVVLRTPFLYLEYQQGQIGVCREKLREISKAEQALKGARTGNGETQEDRVANAKQALERAQASAARARQAQEAHDLAQRVYFHNLIIDTLGPDGLRREAMEKVNNTLTGEQKTEWAKMVGEPFDLTKLQPQIRRKD